MRWAQNRTSFTWFMGCTKWPTCNGTRDPNGVDSRISASSQNRLHRIIKAAVLCSEDECLTFTTEQLARADLYDLDIEEVTESQAFVVTVVPRK